MVTRLSSLLDIVFPRFCLSCDSDLTADRNTWLCNACLARIEPLGPGECPVCAGSLGPDVSPADCKSCRRLRPRFSAATAVGRYDGLLGELVSRLKYGPDPALAWPLGELLASALRIWHHLPEIDLIVPVPMGVPRRLRRGFNQAEMIAGEAARRLSAAFARRALVRCRGVDAQAGLARTRRLAAQRKTMCDPATRIAPLLARLPPPAGDFVTRGLRRSVRGRVVLVVDDVMTTGATMSEAARALLEAGAKRVLAAAVARA